MQCYFSIPISLVNHVLEPRTNKNLQRAKLTKHQNVAAPQPVTLSIAFETGVSAKYHFQRIISEVASKNSLDHLCSPFAIVLVIPCNYWDRFSFERGI